jgi:hypothetical protein
MYVVNTQCVETKEMVKDAAISMRVEPSLKARLEAEAAKAGMTLAAYAERALDVHSRGPVWMLIYPDVLHSERAGTTTIVLPVANGWPVASLTLEHAEHLGKQLLGAVAAAKRIDTTSGAMKGYTEDPNDADRID